jgi:glycerol-3-phosphate dehydrogenase (NAD(P)+)
MVIDSENQALKELLVKEFRSDLIRYYYGEDLIGTEIGAAAKNVMGIVAGILDGCGYVAMKGALMARAPIEVGRFIRHFGGNPQNAYGLAHLGDYEATLFSPHSHNRKFGEMFAKGQDFGKLAEGVATLKAVKMIADEQGIDMPICQALYKVVYEKADIKR